MVSTPRIPSYLYASIAVIFILNSAIESTQHEAWLGMELYSTPSISKSTTLGVKALKSCFSKYSFISFSNIIISLLQDALLWLCCLLHIQACSEERTYSSCKPPHQAG